MGSLHGQVHRKGAYKRGLRGPVAELVETQEGVVS